MYCVLCNILMEDQFNLDDFQFSNAAIITGLLSRYWFLLDKSIVKQKYVRLNFFRRKTR